ncbi:sensor histidine kinase [Sinomonas sp. ASV322]|uniref:sensor histidine kinase n=1 Tax=Sinomonas sp. ASV322 TaxID=3041920 RepID=UPI0027DBAA79|nr:sensor histidine kinase [Sinomonas sp. ASV322]MDQ4500728.1 sensor histidine kinase [Sinomonas sp. ASV322]
MSLARRLFLLLVFAVVLFTAFIATAFFLDARDLLHQAAGKRTLSASEAIANSPFVVSAALGAAHTDPSALLQPYAAKVSSDGGLDFITIMAPDGTRWTHPNPAEIGGKYIGSTAQALAGQAYTETTTGTLGPSVRTIVPIKDPGTGRVVGMVATGVTVTNLDVALSSRIPALLAIAVVILILGSFGARLLERRLEAATHGYGLEQLSQLFAYYESVLHSVREGVVMVSPRRRLVIRNDQASELLGLPAADADAPPPLLDDLDLPESLRELLASGRTAHDELHLTKDRVLIVNQEPASGPSGRRARPLGSVATLRDQTEIETLGSELATMRTLSDALRSQTHEHANRLHTIVSLLELGRTEEALAFATDDLALSQALANELVVAVHEPVLAALVMGKSAQAHERGVQLDAEASGRLEAAGLEPKHLVTIVGNLLDNAIDAAAGGDAPKWAALEIHEENGAVVIEVSDSGPGVPAAERERVLQFGYSTKPHGSAGRGLGLALVRRSVEALGGTLGVAGDRGAVFTVAIPARARGTDRTAPQEPSREGEP